MRRARLDRRLWVLGLLGLFAAVLIGVSFGGTQADEAPAPPAVLSHIADKNHDAAIDAAAQFKAKAEATSEAADARAGTMAPAAANASAAQ